LRIAFFFSQQRLALAEVAYYVKCSETFRHLFGISYFIATVGVPANSYFGNSSEKKFDIAGAKYSVTNCHAPRLAGSGGCSLTYFVSKKGKHVPTDQLAFMPSGIVAAMYV
jgi:hypothetical protein